MNDKYFTEDLLDKHCIELIKERIRKKELAIYNTAMKVVELNGHVTILNKELDDLKDRLSKALNNKSKAVNNK